MKTEHFFVITWKWWNLNTIFYKHRLIENGQTNISGSGSGYQNKKNKYKEANVWKSLVFYQINIIIQQNKNIWLWDLAKLFNVTLLTSHKEFSNVTIVNSKWWLSKVFHANFHKNGSPKPFLQNLLIIGIFITNPIIFIRKTVMLMCGTAISMNTFYRNFH